MGFAFISCEDKDEIRVPEVEKGPNVRLRVDPEFSFINFDDLNSAKLKFDLFSESKNLHRVDITARYYSLTEDSTYKDVVVKSYTQADINNANGVILNQEITAQELVTALNLPEGLNNLSGGDRFQMINFVTMENGTVYPDTTLSGNLNIEAGIIQGTSTSYTVTFNAFVGCPSPQSDIVGTYTAEIVTENTAGGPPFGLPNTSSREVTVSFSGPEPFRYTVSSHDAGWWARPDVTATEGGPADFFDICGQIITQPIASFGFGGASDAGGGSYDPETGIITLNWYNPFNDIYGFVVLTPKE